MKVTKIYIVFFISFMFFSNILSQNNSDSLLIVQELNNIFNEEYILWNYVNIDSVENIFRYNTRNINDPYGTLNGCIVFLAAKRNLYGLSNGIVGVYKNNKIIWHSDFIKSNEINSAGIYAIVDITNDGKAEIITGWNIQNGSRFSYNNLYIYSWDGNQGNIKVISYEDGFSSVSSHEYKGFDYVDFEGDGIWEIISYDADFQLRALPKVNSYDGNLYAVSKTIRIDSINMFFPRNNFIPHVKTSVKKREEKYLYSYELYNSEESKQSINTFSVYNDLDAVDNVTAPKGWNGDSRHKGVSWEDSTNNKGFTMKYKIAPGQTFTDFSYITNGLPIIADAYLRGYNYQWIGDYMNNTRRKDYLNNSVIVKTLASRLPLSPFVPNNFIDTLKSYNTQSYELGWIKEEGTYKKYSEYITKAKTSLEAQDTTMAVINLESVLSEVDKDSSTTLTSEAYALLKFNTEYLVKQLPEVKIENLLDALINKSHESYHTRWIFKYSVYVNIVKRLDNIKKAYLSNRLTSAEYMLDSFFNKLKRHKRKSITEAAYEYFNTYSNYIRDKIIEEKNK